jgi:hypothetical protein
MQQFVRSGIAVVFVSHNLSAISALCDRVLVLRQGRVQTLAPTQEAITAYAGMVQETRVAEIGRHEVNVQVLDQQGTPISEVCGGGAIAVRVAAFPPADGNHFYAELQVRHLESGNLIYRCQSRALGAEPVELLPGEGLEAIWSLRANLGRGHYALACAILNERHRWVAVSSPTLLTVDERESENALVFLDASCTSRALTRSVQAAVAG